MNTIRLAGCVAEPLGSYLKALAVLRLVSEQADPTARGRWSDAGFCLETELDEACLVEFFLERYAPTPILSPWNGGSGFYPKDRKVGLDALVASKEERFSVYREAIKRAGAIKGVGADKAASAAEEDLRRTKIQLACRNTLPDACVEWLDAAVGISAEGKRAFAPILGTGGNEGRLDYTNNFMECIADLLISPDEKTPVADLLRNALFGTSTRGYQPGSVGQYDPGRAGGFNQGQGVETADFPSNPWNFVLTLEGGVAWAAGLHRRQGVAFRSFLCSPFTVRATPVGYGSASAKDGALARAEIWAPVWDRPATYAEVKALLREGRAAIGGKPAQNGLEFAQAATMLGVDRGIKGFVRYNLLKRRGDSYVALPAGRFAVEERKESDLARELTALLDETDWQLKGAPAEYDSLRRQVDEAMFNMLLRGGEATVQDLAASVGRLHRWILTTGKSVQFRRKLSREWVAQLRGVPTARVAAALAGIWHRDAGAFRDHLDRTNGQFAWIGGNLAERMTRVLERRILLGDAQGFRHNALGSSYRALPGDAVRFMEGSLDDESIEDLLFAFTLVDWRLGEPIGVEPPVDEIEAWPVYALLKHLFLAEPVRGPEGDLYLRGDLGVLAALRAGDMERAAEIGARRLQNAGLLPVNASYLGGFECSRLAASLLIPVPYHAAMRRILKSREAK
jgi:CRISPR-associated protein Csx17